MNVSQPQRIISGVDFSLSYGSNHFCLHRTKKTGCTKRELSFKLALLSIKGHELADPCSYMQGHRHGDPN